MQLVEGIIAVVVAASAVRRVGEMQLDHRPETQAEVPRLV